MEPKKYYRVELTRQFPYIALLRFLPGGTSVEQLAHGVYKVELDDEHVEKLRRLGVSVSIYQ